MENITIQQIDAASPLYTEVWELREEILRKPLGLSLKNEDLSRDNHNAIFIAQADDRVIGCVFLEPLSGGSIQLRAMAVYVHWQGKGIGKLLVQHAESYAWSQGYMRIELHARKVALGFYDSMGYTSYGPEFTEVGIPHYMMEKKSPVTTS